MADDGNYMRPDFIGIGVQKCATTWIFNALREHPRITMAMPADGDKDTRFFSHFYDRGQGWYEQHFHGGRASLCGEYSTSYFCSPEAPERIWRYRPDMLLIVSLRHPVERAFSNHKHNIRLGKATGLETVFENAWQRNPMYLDQSRYYTHLMRWLEFFPREQIHAVVYDDIISAPARVVEKLYAFLGVDTRFQPARYTERLHESRLPRSSLLETFIRGSSRQARRAGLSRVIDYFKKKGIKRIVDRANSRDNISAFPPMKEETKQFLLQYFQEENRLLSEWLGRNLSAWEK